jgi:hypothetical protein
MFKFLNRNEQRALFLLFFIALILRAAFVWYQYATKGMEGWNDALYYIHLGKQIAEGNWNPDGYGRRIGMFVAPVVPLLVAFFMKLFNEPVVPFLIYNVFATSLMVPVLYYFGKEVFNSSTGWLLAIWGVFFFWSFWYSRIVLKEATIFLLIPLSLLFLVRSLKLDHRLKNLFFAAFTFSVLIHTDERYIIYAPLILLMFLCIKPFKFISYFKVSFIYTALILLFMLPWGIHNYQKYGQIVIITARTAKFTSSLWGKNLYIEVHKPSHKQKSEKPSEERLERAEAFAKEHGIELKKYSKTEARINAFIHLWRPVLFKPVFIVDGLRPDIWPMKTNIINILNYGIFLPFYLIGIPLLWRRKNYLGLLIAMIPILHNATQALLMSPLMRYRLPINFIIAMIGIWVMLEMLTKVNLKGFKNPD